MAWGGVAPAQKKKKNPLEYVEKIIGPPQYWTTAPPPPPPPHPYSHISTILPGPSFSFRPYVLQIEQKVGPLHLNTQVQTLTTKFHFLSISKNPPTNPQNPLFPLLLILLFCLL